MIGAGAGEARLLIEASPDRVYALVSDVTRMGEWSPECRGGEWLAGATGPAVGASFRGDNRIGPRRWSTTSKVVAAVPGREFAFAVMVRGQEATRWRYQLELRGDGTLVTESFDYVWAPWYFAAGNLLIGRRWQLRRAMRATLARLKAVAEAADPVGSPRSLPSP